MPEVEPLSARYCPECGLPVKNAVMLATNETDLPITGTFERKGAHAIVEPTQIRVFEHGDRDGDAA